MSRRISILIVVLLTAEFWLPTSGADGLPGFEDFRRIDRTRRFTGQMHTAEFLQVSRIDAGLLERVARENPRDGRILWGAAELLVEWPRRRELFERALEISGTNATLAGRFACAAAQQRDFELADKWLAESRKHDSDNTVPWLVELWIQREQGRPMILSNAPPIWATNFRDYSAAAIRARIRTLEAAGYSPYAARRLGFAPDSPAITMTRDLIKPPMAEQTAELLKHAADAMQRHPPFLLWEMVGQTIERALMAQRPDAATSVEVRYRNVEIDNRRQELTKLLADVERNAVEFATETEMVRYFDDVLDLGEETAMRKLAETVGR